VLVVPDFDQLEKWAKYKQIAYADRAQLITLPAVREKMDREVLGPLSDLAHFELPKRVLLLEHEFSLENDELTPSLKVKRRVVDAHYRVQIDALYGSSPGSAR
jgi:long-chain acyl-CoA synthetase